MIKRTSLVWKRADLTDVQFRALWLGEHVEYAKQLQGLREYVIDFVTEGYPDGPAGIATLRFDSREALNTAFGDTRLRNNLIQTRAQFARAAEVTLVDEHIVVPCSRRDER
jgi:uncharacterized protein (TIGR02118 family)